MMSRTRLLVPLLAGPLGLGAQAVPPDAGTLVIRQRGSVVAREAFQVRRDGTNLTVTSTLSRPAGNLVVLAVYSPRRVTVRLSGSDGEVAREFPAGGTMILDDSVFVFLLLLPQHQPGTIRLARPRAPGRIPATLEDRGTGTGTEHEWRLTFGSETIRAWYGPDGRFVRAEIPSRELQIGRDRPD